MNFLHIFITSIVSLIAMFIATKIMGNREISQLSMFDYINGITIGSIAAELAICDINEMYKHLIAILIYAIFIFIISLLTNKSILIDRFVNGNSIIIYDNDTFFTKNMNKIKMNIPEFFTQCRDKGFFNLDDIQTVIMESSGKISILAKSNKRAITPQDLAINVESEYKIYNIIIDGKILKDNLKATGKNEDWLYKKIKEQNLYLNDIFLATCDSNSNIKFYMASNKEFFHDGFK